MVQLQSTWTSLALAPHFAGRFRLGHLVKVDIFAQDVDTQPIELTYLSGV